MRIGLISDTHGLLRPQALAQMKGSDCILHAGDIGDEAVLRALQSVAPVHAVRGNNDHGPWADALPETLTLSLRGVRVHLLHDLKQLQVDLGAERLRVVVSGHSHKPLVAERAGVLYVNPGSAGPRRFRLPVTVGVLLLDDSGVRAEVLPLDVAG
jgi:putative phosphoesterase